MVPGFQLGLSQRSIYTADTWPVSLNPEGKVRPWNMLSRKPDIHDENHQLKDGMQRPSGPIKVGVG